MTADVVAVDDLLAEGVTGAIGPLISKSSTSQFSGAAARFPDATVGGVDVGGATGGTGTGLGRGLDDEDDDCAGVAVDTRAALVDCVVVVAAADFLDGAGRAFDGWGACVTGGAGAGAAVF